MLKRNVLFLGFVLLISKQDTLAHNGVDHGPHGDLNPHVTPTVPAAVPAPPPVVVPPPPVVNVAMPILPTIFSNTTILPTDANSPFLHPSADALNRLKQQVLTKEQLAELEKADQRYQFTGEWHLFSSNYAADALTSSPFIAVGYTGGVHHLENRHVVFKEPTFMPTMQAEFSKKSDTHLRLEQGAVVVRADQPVTITSLVGNQEVHTHIGKGAFVLVSAFDGKTTLLHLTDKSKGGLHAVLPAKHEHLKTINLIPGQVAEIYNLRDKPTSNLVATKVNINERISDDKGLLVNQCHYVRAIKKFNLRQVIPKFDYDRVLKTAAAVGYVRH